MKFQILDDGQKIVFTFKDPLEAQDQQTLATDMLKAVELLSILPVVIDITDCMQFSHLGYGSIVTFRLSPNFLSQKVSLRYSSQKQHAIVSVLRLEHIFDLQPV